MLDLSRLREKPFEHQVVGIQELVKYDDPNNGRHIPGCFALFDEMGAGKTKQVIDAFQYLFTYGDIQRVLVVCPASVRPVWFDYELGELRKHLWHNFPARVVEYHSRVRDWFWGPKTSARLEIVITNYDFIRQPNRRVQLRKFCKSAPTLLVLDESSAIKNHRAQQTQACLELRQYCRRVVLLNGTPIANNPLDMYAQGLLMDPGILNCATWTHFRAKYAIIGGFAVRGRSVQILGWQNLEDLQARFKPYVLRRLKTDCLDLPPKMPPVTLQARLTPETWDTYKKMRDEMVAWLDQQTVSVAPMAITKAIRLSQITSGFLGGLQNATIDEDTEEPGDFGERPDWIPEGPWSDPANVKLTSSEDVENTLLPGEVREIGREKLDVFLAWLDDRFEEDENFKVLAWVKFRPELKRLIRELPSRYPKAEVHAIWGSQKKAERTAALRVLDPRTAPKGPVIVVGTQRTGSMGLNLTATNTVVYLSHDHSLFYRKQSEDRVHRPGQIHAVNYYDVIAVGPNNQKTLDHAILKALREKDNVAAWTTSAWRSVLKEEAEQ